MRKSLINIKNLLWLFSLVFFLSANILFGQSQEKNREKAHTEQKKKPHKKKKPAVQKVSFEAIVPVIKFEVPVNLLTFAPRSILKVFVIKHVSKVFPLSSYLQNLFACIMQVNAP